MDARTAVIENVVALEADRVSEYLMAQRMEAYDCNWRDEVGISK
jgi:hypothetical protein